MESKQLTIYMCKNTRKNSKCSYKTLTIFECSNKLKKEFTIYDIYDALDYMRYWYNNGYTYMRLCVYDNNFCITCFYDKITYNKEVMLSLVYHYFKYLNCKEFNFTLSDLYNDKNIKYIMNKFSTLQVLFYFNH